MLRVMTFFLDLTLYGSAPSQFNQREIEVYRKLRVMLNTATRWLTNPVGRSGLHRKL